MNWENNVRRVVPYVAGEQPQNPKIIKLNTNECPYPPSPKVAEALRGYDTANLRKYPDMNITPLIEALAGLHGISPEQIFVGIGSDDVLSMAFLTFFNSGKPILFPDVTYSFYDVWADLYKIPYECQPLDEGFNIVKTDYFKENGGIVIANPNAPTAILAKVSDLEEIIQANPDSVVIIDEAYIDFALESKDSCLPLIDKYDNLLVTRTFSKSRSMAGMRIGYACGSEKLIKYLNDVKFSFNSYTLSTPAILAGVASVEDNDYFVSTCNKVRATRTRIFQELQRLGFEETVSSTNFLFAAHEKVSAQQIFDALKENGIYVRHWNKPRIDNFLRITVGTDEEMDTLVAFLKSYL